MIFTCKLSVLIIFQFNDGTANCVCEGCAEARGHGREAETRRRLQDVHKAFLEELLKKEKVPELAACLQGMIGSHFLI